LRNELSGEEYILTGHFCKCRGANWCPRFPVYGGHEFSVMTSPRTSAATEFVVVKVRLQLQRISNIPTVKLVKHPLHTVDRTKLLCILLYGLG